MYFEVDGKQVFAATDGKSLNNNQPTIIFLHGSGFDHGIWDLQMRFFADRNYSVVAPDLPGHTNSAGPPLESIEAMAEWLSGLTMKLDLRNISLVGHSQGCLIALEHAARYPDRQKTASLIASGHITPVNGDLLAAATDNPEAAIEMMVAWGYGASGQYDRDSIPGNSMLANGLETLRGNTPGALAADLNACNNYQNGMNAAAAMPCPVQVIVAGKDRMAPKKATDALIAQLEQPDVSQIPDSGHIVPQEAPGQCCSLLCNFIVTHNPAG